MSLQGELRASDSPQAEGCQAGVRISLCLSPLLPTLQSIHPLMHPTNRTECPLWTRFPSKGWALAMEETEAPALLELSALSRKATKAC